MSPWCGCLMVTVTMVVTVMTSQLLAPQNVELTSYNMNLTLRWSPPQNVTSDIFYSTQLWIATEPKPRAACVNITALHCELSDPSLGLSIMEFGQYNASVRAHCGMERSEWAYSQNITMDRDTVIGPPDVSLVPNEASVEVIMREPKFQVSTLEKVFGLHQYNISYWPRGRQKEAVHMLVQQNRAVVNDLEPQSDYCVQVRVHVSPVRNQKPTEASEPSCVTTKNKPTAPWQAAVLTFFALVLAVALLVIAIVYHKRVFYFLCPKDRLPSHLPERPRSLSHLTLEEEVYDPLSVVPGLCSEEGTVPDKS